MISSAGGRERGGGWVCCERVMIKEEEKKKTGFAFSDNVCQIVLLLPLASCKIAITSTLLNLKH